MRDFRDNQRFHFETGEGLCHAAHAAGEMVAHDGPGSPPIDRAHRFGQTVRAIGKQNVGRRPHGPSQQSFQKVGGHFRHVAGDDEVPIGGSVIERREDSAQRPSVRVAIGNGRQLRVPDQGDVTGGRGHRGGHRAHQIAPAKRQAGFVPAHPGTAPPSQHIPRANHKEMITLGLQQTLEFAAGPVPRAGFSARIRGNILRQFCFILTIAGFAAGVMPGAGLGVPQRITSVVRPDLRTGKLVRSVVVSPKPVTEPSGIDEAVRRIAAEHELPPQLIHSVIKVESNYNAHAISSKGALGLMQLIPATARRFGVSDAFNPVENIQGGAKYLRYLLDLYKDNYPLALAAYNAGEGAVARYGGVPPFAETQNYVTLVRRQLELAQKAGAAKTVGAATPPQAVEAKEAGPAHVVEIVQADGSVRYVSR